MDKIALTAVFVANDGGYTVYLKEMRGVISEGDTIEEAYDMVHDALKTYLIPDIIEPNPCPYSDYIISKRKFKTIEEIEEEERPEMALEA